MFDDVIELRFGHCGPRPAPRRVALCYAVKMNTTINASLVARLVAEQFPEYADLPVRFVANGGWDNRTFHLGDRLLARLPSANAYAPQVEKEQTWLPKLAPHLPLEIPKPVAMGAPALGYPYRWSLYEWIAGQPAAHAPIDDMVRLATDLASFLNALQTIDGTDAPAPGPDNFHRGGDLSVYDAQTRDAISPLSNDYDPSRLLQLWEAGLDSAWDRAPVFVHGDISPGNLLMRGGRLCAVIDFGQLAAGDPACDLAVAWRFFDEAARAAFRDALSVDDGTWARGRSWALWKALIIRAGLAQSNDVEMAAAARTLDAIITEARGER